MDLKNFLLQAIERIAKDNDVKDKDITITLVKAIENHLYFSVFADNTLRTPNKNILWKTKDIFNLNAVSMMNLNAYLSAQSHTLQEKYESICTKYDINPKEGEMYFTKDLLEQNKILLSDGDDINIGIDYKLFTL